MKYLLLPFLLFFISLPTVHSKTMTDTLPYYQIPDAPKEYNACTVAARLLDGLGYRYYWATENLRAEDFDFKPSPEGRTILETMDHIYGLTNNVLNTTLKKPNIRGDKQIMSAEELRKATLENIAQASQILKDTNSNDLDQFKIIFQRGDRSSEFPFWNQLNGPIADALWHCGQIVTHRRTSGNPLPAGVSVFNGKTRKQ